MNSAIAEPSASVAYAQTAPAPGMNDAGRACPVDAALVASILSCAAPKMRVPAADLAGQVDDRDDDHEVDQDVLDERDHRRRPQAAGVGVGRQQREGDEQRQVLGEELSPPPSPATSSTAWMPTSCRAM